MVLSLAVTTAWADSVSKEDAAALAGSFLSGKASPNKAPALNLTTTTTDLKMKVVDLSESVESDYFYVIQNEDGEGWVLMAADDAVQPILAYSKTGTFNPDNMPANLKDWLGMYNDQIKQAVELNLTASTEVTTEWKNLRGGLRKATQATAVVGPLLSSKWDQEAPYYNNCPTNTTYGHSVVGCVATAMAQVMKFWQWPNQGQGSKTYRSANYGNLTVNFANATYDWSNMRDTYGRTGTYTTAEADAVALLSYHCGVAVEMDYNNANNGGSGAYTLNYGDDNSACAQNALWKYFKYDYSTIKSYYRDGSGTTYASWSETNWKNMLKEELNQGRPIIYSGRGSGGGHCFVCDGYDSDSYFHFISLLPCGINNLVPGSGGAGGAGYSFSNSQGCVIGIKPVVDEKFTVTYNAGSHATCATPTQQQSSIGASVTLPNVSSVAEHYMFLGWSDRENSQTPNIGKAGDSYTPMRNITLYAVVVQDGYVVHFIPTIVDGTLAIVDSEGDSLFWNGTPNWSGHGSCEVDSLREEGTGTGIILPSATGNAGWTFQQWYAVSTSGNLYSAGYPGDRFYPSGNQNLFGYWTEDSKVWLDYILMGVTKTGGQDEGWIEFSEGLNATFVAADNFDALTNANTTVTVKVDGDTVNNCYSITNNVLTITLTADQLIGDVDIVIQATENYDPCSNYSYTYTRSQGTGNSKTLGAYTWSITKTGQGSANNYDNTLGQQFGTVGSRNTTPYSAGTVTYTTSTPADCHINTITINAASTLTFTYAQYEAGLVPSTIEAFIGNVSLGIQYIYPNTDDDPTTYTRNNTTYYNWPGELTAISWQNTSNLTGALKFVMKSETGVSILYVKSINVTMSESVLGGPYHVPVNFLQAYYLEEENKHVWYTQMFGDGDYPYVLTIFDAADETSIAGTHSTEGLQYEGNASEVVVAYEAPDITLTYKQTSGTYYDIYHVATSWMDSEGRQYYIDDDVTTLLINYQCYADAKAENPNTTLSAHTECIDHPTSDEGNTKITYTVNHYQQDVTGSGYTKVATATFSTKSGNTITAEQNSYTGFITPDPISITVTNTNKTVDYYYDRRTYPVSFVVNNIAVQTDDVRYKDTPAYRGATPQRAATEDYVFTFAGWSPNISPVKQAATYTAQFNTTPRVTVTFDINGHGTAPIPQSVFPGETITRPDDPTAEGYTFGGWYTAVDFQTAWNFSDPVNASMVLIAKWTANQHNLSWNAAGGIFGAESYTNGPVAYGTTIVAPTVTRQGYTFAGWDGDVPATMPDNDLAFTAQWNPNTNTAYKVRHCKQNLDDDNFTQFEEENLTGTTGAEVTPDVKTYEGFSAPQTQTAYIQADGQLVITYNYTRNVHSLVWNANGGNITGSYTSGQVKYGKSITAPAAANVTKVGASFNGWLPAEIPATMPDDDQTFVAQWLANTYTISFTSEDINKGTVTVTGEKATYTYNDQVTILAEAKAGYVFDKWSDGNTNAERTLTIGVDVTTSLTASFKPSTHTLYIIHHFQQNITDDDWTEILPVDSAYGTTGQLTNAAPYNKQYTGFEEPSYEDAIIAADGSTEINMTYLRKTFTIRFLVDDVEKQRDELRYQAQPAFRGATPTKEPDAQFTYSFGGWNPTIGPAVADQEYKAKWNTTVNQYTVTFNANGHGVAPAPQTVDYNTPATEPAALEETGWTFGGWFKEETCGNAWNFADPIVESIELFAKWTVNTHDLTWNLAGGTTTTAGTGIASGVSSNTTTSQAYGTPIVAPAVERTGFNFIGWNPSVKETMPDEDVTYVANWQEAGGITYKVLHKRQNLAGTAFDIVEVENFEGVTGAPVTPLVKDYEGFDAPAQKTANILADGSLEIVYEYTRLSFNLIWNANGGTITSAEGDYTHGSVKFEAPITAPADPIWAGHEFHNWAPNPDNYPTMPARGLTFEAQWTTNTYSGITFTSENDVEGTVIVTNGKDTYTYGDEVTIEADPAEGYHFTGWENGDGDVVSTSETVNITVDANTESLTATFAPNEDTKYKVSHYLQNIQDDEYGIFLETENFTGTTGALIVAAPRSIDGFITPANQVDVRIAGDGSTEIIYNYKRLTNALTWDANGGVLLDNGRTEGDEIKFQAPIKAAVAERTGYTFLGWKEGEVIVENLPTEMPSRALHFVAQWDAVTYPGITFISENPEEGTVIVSPNQTEFSHDDEVTITAKPAEGYEFAGWENGSGQVVSTSETLNIKVDENTESLTATFNPLSVAFEIQYFIQNLNDNNFSFHSKEVGQGYTGTEISPDRKYRL